MEWHRNGRRASDLCFSGGERKPERRTQRTHAHMKREGERVKGKQRGRGEGGGGEEEVAVFGVKGEVG